MWTSSTTERAVAEIYSTEFTGVQGHPEQRAERVDVSEDHGHAERIRRRRASIWYDEGEIAVSCSFDETRRDCRVALGGSRSSPDR